ncbi:hypothetical protein RHECNPAF_2330041 [Rhizobium etli CNPAF512]|nr:hypothetical protein RHECNPAF_2330041 [Rhizobium etli CNPAF512]
MSPLSSGRRGRNPRFSHCRIPATAERGRLLRYRRCAAMPCNGKADATKHV